jgi:hypothetical protein
MTRPYDQVQAALETHLTEYNGAPHDPETGDLLIAFENDRFEPATGQVWWRVQFVPVGSERGSAGEDGYTRIDGELVVDLFYPAGGGSGQARRAADDLVRHFRSAQTVTSKDGVDVWIRGARREPALSEERWFSVQVRVRWTTHQLGL